MSTLFLDYIPQDLERLKNVEPLRTQIVGGGIYASEVVNALLRHSRLDQIVLLYSVKPNDGDIRDSELFLKHSDRISFIAEHELPDLRAHERLVLFATGSRLPALDRIRRAIGRRDIPIVGAIHTISFRSYLGAVYRLLSLPLESFDALICSTKAGRTAIQNYSNEAIRRATDHGVAEHLSAGLRLPIIPLGIEIDPFSSRDKARDRQGFALASGPVLLYFGRLAKNTKADLYPLILVFRQLLDHHPDITLLLAGDDTREHLAEDLKEFAESVGCKGRVMVFGDPSRAQKEKLYGAADVFVSPSDNLQETFGVTILEAMAAGLPVVASDWNGYKDLVVDGETGILIPTAFPLFPDEFDVLRGSGTLNVSDLLACTTVVDPRILKNALEALIINKESRLRLGAAGRNRVNQLYSWSVVIRRYEDLWEELINEAKSISYSAAKPIFDLDGYSYKAIFSHYPSKHILYGSKVRRADPYWGPIEMKNILKTASSPSSWFAPEKIELFWTLIDAGGYLTVGDLVSRASKAHAWTDTQTLSFIARLMKYGLLEIVLPE